MLIESTGQRGVAVGMVNDTGQSLNVDGGLEFD
jgi:hypothetical protein